MSDERPPLLLPVAGERQNNADGSIRQAEIRRCLAGEVVTLLCEPADRSRPAQVTVLSRRAVQIGHLAAPEAGPILAAIGRGMAVTARIEGIVNSPRGAAPCRIVIRVSMKAG
jgi:hypothetical protein